MTQPAAPCTRRRLLLAAAAAAPWMPRAAAHGSFGPVEPALAAPAVALQGLDGRQSSISNLLQGRVTALQLMFTGCSATCPIQGALFADAQQRLPAQDPRLRLLSVSIDPLGDDSKALQRWLAQFGAQPWRWSAALPRVQDLDRLLDFLRGRTSGPDRHTAQAFVFDRQARLVYRTEDMPNPAALVQLMQRIAARA
jgi:protein SCO1